jgi:hypothetical protein
MPIRAANHRLVSAAAVVGVLYHALAAAQTADNGLLTKYLPAIAAATSTFNPHPLALVDTLPNRKQTPADSPTDPDPPFPSQYTQYRDPFDHPYDPLTNVPGNCTNLIDGSPRPWTEGTTSTAGFSFIDSTGTRYLQFLLVTCGVPDDPNDQNAASNVSHTAQTWYRTSNDQGVNFGPFKQLIARGSAPLTPLSSAGVDNIVIGTNGYQFPGNSLIVSSNQEQDVLIPIEILPPLNQQHTDVIPVPYAGVRIVRGHWRSDGSDLDWDVGDMAEVATTLSTRGLDETAIVEPAVPGGRCVIVSRGSNQNGALYDQGDPAIAGHYWLFQSQDGCKTWSPDAGVALGWDDGSIYYAPAAPPFLFKDRDGRVIFLGAQSDTNSTADLPRGKVIAAELDMTQLKLLKDTAVIVDEKYGTDTDQVDLIYANRYFPQGSGHIFYYTYRQDPGRPVCLDGMQDCYPHNWHLLHPIPNPSAAFSISADPAVPNQVDWTPVPGTQTFSVYARRPQGFWEWQGTAPGSATGFLLQSLPTGADVEVTVFAADDPDGAVTSSNQITIHVQ